MEASVLMKKTTPWIWIGLAVLTICVYAFYTDYYLKVMGERKLESISFVEQDDYYLRYVEEDEAEWKEIFELSDNNFVRMYEIDGEIEVYSYNYEEDTFTYLYYFEGEQILKVVYDYEAETVVEDEDSVYETLSDEVIALKEYFEELLTENDIAIEEL